MGTICSLLYANIFIADFELKYINPYITKMFFRFIDDFFMIWTSSEEESVDFMSDLNKKHSSIKLSSHKQKFNS